MYIGKKYRIVEDYDKKNLQSFLARLSEQVRNLIAAHFAKKEETAVLNHVCFERLRDLGIDKDAPLTLLTDAEWFQNYNHKMAGVYKPMMMFLYDGNMSDDNFIPDYIHQAFAGVSIQDLWNDAKKDNLVFAESMEWAGFNPSRDTVLAGILMQFFCMVDILEVTYKDLIQEGILCEAK